MPEEPEDLSVWIGSVPVFVWVSLLPSSLVLVTMDVNVLMGTLLLDSGCSDVEEGGGPLLDSEVEDGNCTDVVEVLEVVGCSGILVDELVDVVDGGSGTEVEDEELRDESDVVDDSGGPGTEVGVESGLLSASWRASSD